LTTKPGWLASKACGAASSAAAGFMKPAIRNSEENIVTRYLRIRNAKTPYLFSFQGNTSY
jgi:hypothetical protein